MTDPAFVRIQSVAYKTGIAASALDIVRSIGLILDAHGPSEDTVVAHATAVMAIEHLCDCLSADSRGLLEEIISGGRAALADAKREASQPSDN
jgi:hypothetical protein